jgi:hypothetical protein
MALAVALLTYLVSSDVGLSAALALIVGLLVFPLAFVAREFILLAREVDQDRAGKVYEWLTLIATRLGVGGVQLAYTVRTNLGGIQIVSLGSQAVHGQARITALLHRAAWYGLPVAEQASGGIVIVVPGLLMEKLTSMIISSGKKLFVIVTGIMELKLVYSLIRAICRAVVGSRLLAAYMATKMLSKLTAEGLIALAMPLEALEKAEKLLPFEDPITRFLVRRQLRLELALGME